MCSYMITCISYTVFMCGFLVNITAMINKGKFLEMHQISLSKEDMENMENEISMLLISQRFNSATMPVMITHTLITI